MVAVDPEVVVAAAAAVAGRGSGLWRTPTARARQFAGFAERLARAEIQGP